MTKSIKGLIPNTIKKPLKRFVLRYFGWDCYCPICRNWFRSFEPFGIIPRPNARCPVCSSLERHRSVWYFFENQTNLFDKSPKSMLHVAPELEFERRLRRFPGIKYISADLYSPKAMLRMDITNVPCADNCFDVIYCSHVLEHIPDDRRAKGELSRVLKHNGWAVILVPITSQETFEDPSEANPIKRLNLFGQEDHIRRYGPDIQERLEQEGFTVRCYSMTEIVGKKK